MATTQEQQETGWQIYLRLLKYLKPLLPAFAISIVGFMIFAATTPGQAKLLELLVDAIENKDHNARYWIPPAIAGLYLIRGVGTFLGSYFMAMVGTRIVTTLRTEIFSHLMRLPVNYYDEQNSGQIIARTVFNTGMVTGAATDAIRTLIREGFTVIGLLAYAFYLNWKMSLIFFAVAPFIGLIVVNVGKRLRKLSTKVQDSVAEITQVCSEAIVGNRMVKTFLGEERETERFVNVNEKNYKQQMKMVKIQALNTPVMQLIIVAAMGVIVFLILAPEFLSEMTTGQYVAYITTIGLIPKPVRQLSGVNAMIQKGIAAAINIFAMLDLPTERNTGTKRVESLRGEIEVSGLSFGYNPETPALRDINFSAKPGQVTALVGRSGSGKSTLASLIARFYDYEVGEIRVDGVDIRDYDLYDYRSQLGIVTQNVVLFNDTIANNIAYGCNAAFGDMEAIRRAADAAHATGFIESLPEGFETMVGESGVKLSGGQRQRIAIARTLLKNTPLLVLDEATSALDNESERAIQTALTEFMKNRTTLVIAHRLSTIVNADQILVMDGGEIVERGTHAELLEQKGYYSTLYEQGFEE
ncbi:subfamily B ATP-binding cassette protein MsbA [Litorivivens lipolytica]|uniref:Subfamily B ATP-binding cassette protein MsbA n=1 Tax=Litorivivens lipolytica TaxID=1524264 RepID=A0A7W4Z561_9GAMM|nr:lipid A export permease/ATP-binding protein MsbA [Litorivivens lipolytica]MBB3046893.1 subfamily B ATP-binding cassette protein MsbA [Litorivivens lipolytica]